MLVQRGGPHQTFPMASRAGCQCPSSPYRRGAVPGAFLQGHGTLQDPTAWPSSGGCAQGPIWDSWRTVAMPEAQPQHPHPGPQPSCLCLAWACGAGRCLHTRALRSLGSGAPITWVFHTLPCQGRVGASGRGQEERGAGRGNQLHESPCSRWAGQPQEAPLPLDKVQRTRWHQPTGTG